MIKYIFSYVCYTNIKLDDKPTAVEGNKYARQISDKT